VRPPDNAAATLIKLGAELARLPKAKARGSNQHQERSRSGPAPPTLNEVGVWFYHAWARWWRYVRASHWFRPRTPRRLARRGGTESKHGCVPNGTHSCLAISV